MKGRGVPPHVYRKGDEGVWIIMSSGRPSHGYGLLKKKRLDEIKRMLRELDKRVWSKPINGIKVWVGAELKGPSWRSHHGRGLMFAVKNVSDKTIYLPLSQYRGIVTGQLRDSAGKEFKLTGFGNRSERGHRPLLCEPLPPRATRYMHPDGADYGFFRLPKDLPAGDYTATITLGNEEADGLQRRPDRKPVKPWLLFCCGRAFRSWHPSWPVHCSEAPAHRQGDSWGPPLPE